MVTAFTVSINTVICAISRKEWCWWEKGVSSEIAKDKPGPEELSLLIGNKC